jgi:hypothetical protein
MSCFLAATTVLRILVIAGCSGEGRLTTPKPDGAGVKNFGKFAGPSSIKGLALP